MFEKLGKEGICKKSLWSYSQFKAKKLIKNLLTGKLSPGKAAFKRGCFRSKKKMVGVWTGFEKFQGKKL